ncbi:uncharacterized protein LOC105641975 isoform X3 [Jatropha curcas]|uniref:uncharacterized protein LOC105641975 isoform X3 n=1 Tax=Jatropha curcas TaxID=180498 RepID=UPI0005FAC2B0|nr:uncharacterized protein LOC105641975 isoform X3 [Jatropha curcas]
MLVQRTVIMSWRRVAKSLLAVVAHSLLFSFTLLLALRLDRAVSCSWWFIFAPLWLFHAVVARGRFSLPAPSMPNDRRWAPSHAVLATPLLIAFELLLCIRLENSYGDVAALGWWDLFINYGIAECFAFLVCTRWYNPAIHRHSHIGGPGSSMSIRYIEWNRGLVVSSDEDRHQSNRICNLQDIGGHFMKIPFIGFQIMLFMRLEGTPPDAEHIPFPVLFAPLLLIQGAGVLFAIYRLVEKIVILLRGGSGSTRYLTIASKVCDFLGFLHHGSRLMGWWSIDEGSREEQARLYYPGCSGYNTFSPDVVKKMPKSELVEEIWRLQAALGEQTEITKFSQQECERLQNEKILCRVCFEDQINVVLLPCRHHVLCSTCCEKCKKCPICRVTIEERLPVYDV